MVFLHQGLNFSPLHCAQHSTGLMVAPHTVGEPVRSLVRVSGEGRTTRALCWDLSRSSSMVAAVAPLQLPLTSPQPPQLLPPSAMVTPDSTGPSTSIHEQVPAAPRPSLPKSKEQVPQPVPQQGPTGASSGGKRLREEDGQQRGEESTHKPKFARTTETGLQQQVIVPAQLHSSSEEEVQRLRQQCRRLQQQNEDLQQRLSEIYRLLKDKQRRNSLVRQLDTLVK